MEWISQNWLLIVFGVGMFMLMRRGGTGCGHARESHPAGAAQDSSHDGHKGRTQTETSGQATDPVSGKALDPGHAIASMYQGVPIYFESRENRERFEAAPEQFPNAKRNPNQKSSHCC